MLNSSGANDIYNNISYGPTFWHITCYESHTTNIDYNLYYPNDGLYFRNYGVENLNFSDWKTTIGEDANSPTPADPLFINAGTNNFRLQKTSPAIDAGVDVSLTQDKDGYPVPYGTLPDIGAYEWHPGGFGKLLLLGVQ